MSFETERLPPDLQQLLLAIQTAAEKRSGNCLDLLMLLRVLEGAHRTIREGDFRMTLPSTRSSLFNLLQNIEEEGGWPYIPRLTIQALLQQLIPADEPKDPSDPA